jgi:hypothetical protein
MWADLVLMLAVNDTLEELEWTPERLALRDMMEEVPVGAVGS